MFKATAEIKSISTTEWETTTELVWVDESENLTVTVPVGFQTDLGSVPSWAQWLVRTDDKQCEQCFILHDYMCEHTQDFGRSFYTPDLTLLKSMIAVEAPMYRRGAIYVAVSLWHTLKISLRNLNKIT